MTAKGFQIKEKIYNKLKSKSNKIKVVDENNIYFFGLKISSPPFNKDKCDLRFVIENESCILCLLDKGLEYNGKDIGLEYLFNKSGAVVDSKWKIIDGLSREIQSSRDDEFKIVLNKVLKSLLFENEFIEDSQTTKLAPKPALPVFKEMIDLTQEALKGKYCVVGREVETNRLIDILGKYLKRNALLIGEPGVGKTAVVEGLAQRIVSGGILSFPLNESRIYSLNTGTLASNSAMRGDLEAKVEDILNFCKSDRRYIIFIDEFQSLLTNQAVNSSDIISMLKPALARGDIKLIAAITPTDWAKIQNDTALTRRFVPIWIDELSATNTFKVLEQIKTLIEDFHKCIISEKALDQAIGLSQKYLPYRRFPDKAIDLLDEAASMMNREEENLNSGSEPVSQKDELPFLTNNYLLETIKIWTGKTDITEIADDDMLKKLSAMESELELSVKGQSEAINKVSTIIKRKSIHTKSAAGVDKKPIGSFIFSGPSGVGKTLLAKELGKFLFGEKERLIRIDCSEFSEAHTITKLTGSPPSYIGYNDPGLFDKLIHNQHQIILFDEIEKAHPDIFNILLQLLDEGTLTNSHGYRIFFSQAIIILTTNLGNKWTESYNKIGFLELRDKENFVKDEKKKNREKFLHNFFRPETLARFDEIIYFNELSEDNVKEIFNLDWEWLCKKWAINIQLTPTAKNKLLELSVDSNYGARFLKKILRTNIEDNLTDLYYRNPDFFKIADNIVLVDVDKCGIFSFELLQANRGLSSDTLISN